MQTYLDLYRRYANEVTDAPPEYHEFLGIASVGAVLGNRVWFPYGDTRIFPNFWLLILAPSSRFRKTTALNISKRLISELGGNHVLPNEFSHEKLIETLSKNPAGSFFFSEFLTLIGLLQRDYMSGTKSLLTDLFDSPAGYRRETFKGDVVIQHPAISIFSASTMDWFVSKLKEEDIGGGFILRFLIVSSKRKARDMPLPPKGDERLRGDLLAKLKEIAGIRGTVYLTEGAREIYTEWYRKMGTTAARHSAYVARLQTYVLKMAICLEANASLALKVGESSMDEACGNANYVYKTLARIMDEEITFNSFQKDEKNVLAIIAEHPKISRSDLLRKSRMSARFLSTVLETILEAGKIVEIRESADGLAKPVARYSTVQKPESGGGP